MTTKQKQLILAWYDLISPKDVDSIWGKQSRAATLVLQGALSIEQDGDFGPATAKEALGAMLEGRELSFKNESDAGVVTGTFWDEIEFFDREELRCQCGGKYCNGYPAEPDERMVRIADAIRKRIGKPITVNSGLRCKTHNANVGGVSNSQHLYGTAADLGCPIGCTPSQMASIAEEIMGETGGIGIYSWGIHIDTRSTKSRWNG